MIETTTEYNRLMIEWIDYEIDASGDDYDPEDALDELQNGDWSDYCPSLISQYRDRMPLKFTYSLDGKKLWTSECIGFDDKDINFIIDTIGRDKLPSVFFTNGGVNDNGCRGCWAFHYYYSLAHIINDESYWRL